MYLRVLYPHVTPSVGFAVPLNCLELSYRIACMCVCVVLTICAYLLYVFEDDMKNSMHACLCVL